MNRFYCGMKSSFVASVSYNPGKLTVTLKKNRTKYEYFFVPSAIFRKMSRADSVGNVYNTLVKGKYPSRKVGKGNGK